MEQFILASASPRRRDILTEEGFTFTVIPAQGEEITQETTPDRMVQDIAYQKGLWVLENKEDVNTSWILACDTLVFLGNTPLGKPENRAHAYQMLQELSGVRHKVISGIALYNPHSKTWNCQSDCTKVSFKKLNSEDIENYLNSGEWTDAAGAYKIQGQGSELIDSVVGSYSNIVGLPRDLLYGILSDDNFPIDKYRSIET
ncbi:Maf family protein [Spirochaeta cellobiosiphila]|uniref:Maf family protein n=1 Tax=Spirochaeta cellobiosiphila TaxID=504483 RepID=UPI00040B5997|nr:Maf family protein [Spirochaeta cellobiosiphila]